MSDSPCVAIILVNFNGVEDTLECLNSLEKVTYRNFRTIVVDNGSRRNEVLRIKHQYPDAVYIRSQINTGFTGGNNIGLATAYKLEPDYIFFLNNDTIVSENIIDELVTYMEANPDTGMVGPMNCYYDQKNTVCFGGGYLDRNTGIVRFVNKGRSISEIDYSPLFCSFIEGSAMFARTSIIKAIGGFYEGYFLTSEESELCVRISDLGYKLAILPNCVIWHKVSKSMGVESELSSYFIFRNKLLFIKRNSKSITPKDLFNLSRYYLICFFSYLLKKRNVSAAKGLLRGVADFLRGVVGHGIFA